MEERLRFVARLLDGDGMSDVCREFGISRKTGYKIWDRYRHEGLEALFKFSQSWDMMVPAIETLKEVLLEGRMQHGANPVLRWCFENVEMTPPNRNGNRIFDKGRSRDRIDGASACLMAIQRAAMGDLAGTFYDRPMADNPAFWTF